MTTSDYVEVRVCQACGATATDRGRDPKHGDAWSRAGRCHLGDNPTGPILTYAPLTVTDTMVNVACREFTRWFNGSNGNDSMRKALHAALARKGAEV